MANIYYGQQAANDIYFGKKLVMSSDASKCQLYIELAGVVEDEFYLIETNNQGEFKMRRGLDSKTYHTQLERGTYIFRNYWVNDGFHKTGLGWVYAIDNEIVVDKINTFIKEPPLRIEGGTLRVHKSDNFPEELYLGFTTDVSGDIPVEPEYYPLDGTHVYLNPETSPELFEQYNYYISIGNQEPELITEPMDFYLPMSTPEWSEDGYWDLNITAYKEPK